jgi:hypothetical protein
MHSPLSSDIVHLRVQVQMVFEDFEALEEYLSPTHLENFRDAFQAGARVYVVNALIREAQALREQTRRLDGQSLAAMRQLRAWLVAKRNRYLVDQAELNALVSRVEVRISSTDQELSEICLLRSKTLCFTLYILRFYAVHAFRFSRSVAHRVFCVHSPNDLLENDVCAQLIKFAQATTKQDRPFLVVLLVDCEDVSFESLAAFCRRAEVDVRKVMFPQVVRARAFSLSTLTNT